MAAKSNVVVSEGQVTFKRVQGHKHDGLTSSLIDTSKYSIFDFIATENSKDSAIAAKQQNNKNVLKTFIINTIEGRVLNPEGIRIQANAISAREIIAGTITADELSSNIVLVNNVIRSNNYISNSTTFTGWAIYSNGEANFNNVNIRGNLKTGNGFYGAANTPLYADNIGQFSLGNKFIWNTTANSLTINAGNLTLGSNLSWDGNTLTISGNVVLNGTNLGTFDNGDPITDGYIGGININANEIQSNTFSAGSSGFRISANGNAEFNNVTVRGDLRFSDNSVPGTFDNGDALTGGSVGGISISGSYIQSTDYDATNGFRIGSDGTAVFNEVTVRGSVTASTISGSTISGSTLSTTDGTNGILLTSDGYITGSGGNGVRIKNVGGQTGVKLFGDVIFTQRIGTNEIDSYDGGDFMTIGRVSAPGGFQVKVSERLYALTSSATKRNVVVTSGHILVTDALSSIRYKTNVNKLSIDYKKILKLEPVSFLYKKEFLLEDDDESIVQYGLIAEQVEEAGLKELVQYDEQNQPDSVDYLKLPIHLLLVCKEQQLKIEELEARIQTLEGV